MDRIKTPRANKAVAFLRFILNSSVTKDTETSNKDIVDVIEAIPTNKKNRVSNTAPKGIA